MNFYISRHNWEDPDGYGWDASSPPSLPRRLSITFSIGIFFSSSPATSQSYTRTVPYRTLNTVPTATRSQCERGGKKN